MSAKQLFRYLDTNGDGTGTKNANGDYSSAAEIFYIQPPSGDIYFLSRMIISVEDTSGFTSEQYGDLGAALSNGITIRMSDDSGIVNEFTDGIPITTNANWGRECYDADVKSWTNAPANELLLVRWTFEKTEMPTILVGNNNERLEIVFNDDLRGLISHYFKVNGRKNVWDLNLSEP